MHGLVSARYEDITAFLQSVLLADADTKTELSVLEVFFCQADHADDGWLLTENVEAAMDFLKRYGGTVRLMTVRQAANLLTGKPVGEI